MIHKPIVDLAFLTFMLVSLHACKARTSTDLKADLPLAQVEATNYERVAGKVLEYTTTGAAFILCDLFQTPEEFDSLETPRCRSVRYDFRNDTAIETRLNGEVKQGRIEWAIYMDRLQVSREWPAGRSGATTIHYPFKNPGTPNLSIYGTDAPSNAQFQTLSSGEVRALQRLEGSIRAIPGEGAATLSGSDGRAYVLDLETALPGDYALQFAGAAASTRFVVRAYSAENGKFIIKELHRIDAEDDQSGSDGDGQSFGGDEVICGNVRFMYPNTGGEGYYIYPDNGTEPYLIASTSRVRPTAGHHCYFGEYTGDGTHGQVFRADGER